MALIGLLVGLGIVALAMFLIVRSDRRMPTSGDPIQSAEELTYWQQQVDQASLDFGLAATRASAGKWAASAAAILGVLTAIAVVAGPSDLAKEVGGTEAQIAATLVLAAGAMAAIATLLAGLAEQGSPVANANLSPQVLRRLTRERALRAAKQIRWSRILTAVALCLILAAAGVAWLTALTGDDAAASGQAAVVVSDRAGSRCGMLLAGDAGSLDLKVAGTSEAIPGDARITLIDSCPE